MWNFDRLESTIPLRPFPSRSLPPPQAGRIVEEGRHASLLEAGGIYSSMWAEQQEAEAQALAEAEEAAREGKGESEV